MQHDSVCLFVATRSPAPSPWAQAVRSAITPSPASQTDDCASPGSSRPVTHRHGEVTDNPWNFGLAISSVSTQVSAVQKTVFLVTLKSKSTARRGNSGRACDFQPSGIKLFHYGRACWRNWKKTVTFSCFFIFFQQPNVPPVISRMHVAGELQVAPPVLLTGGTERQIKII